MRAGIVGRPWWFGSATVAMLLFAAPSAATETPDSLALEPADTVRLKRVIDSLRKSYLISFPAHVEVHRYVSRRSPGSTSGTPSAFGADWGDFFVGMSFQSRMRYVNNDPGAYRMDGAVGAGFGLGDSKKNVGLQISVTSFSTLRSGFLNHMSASFEVHRRLPGNFAVAYGWENAIRVGDLDGGTSMYGVVSTHVRTRPTYDHPFSSVTLSAGIGSGRYQTEQAIDDWRRGLNGFGSIGVRVLRPVSAIAEWTGQDLTLGASFVPFSRVRLSITPAFADVTGKAGDGARFIVSAGMGFNLPGR